MKAAKFPDSATELDWLFEEARQGDYTVPGFVIPKECTRKNALILLHRKYEQAVKHIMCQASEELLKGRNDDISDVSFNRTLDEVVVTFMASWPPPTMT